MAIEKNNVKVGAAVVSSSRLDSEFSVGSKSVESMSSDEDEFHKRNLVDSDDYDDDEFDDADSGAGSDDYDLLELGETGSEFCQVGDQTACIPFQLYDLPDLHGILSLEVWNECLTEEERFGLTKYLPDMDEESFMRTLKELFEGGNFHFGSPIKTLYGMLKGGMCEPRVALYRQGLMFFQTHQHYHLLRRHHDSMVSSLLQMREAWMDYKGYSIDEKLRVLNIVRSQKSLIGERNVDSGSDSSGKQLSEDLLGMRLKGPNAGRKVGHDSIYGSKPLFDNFSRGGKTVFGDSMKYGQSNVKGLSKTGASKNPLPNLVSSNILYGSDLVGSRVDKADMHDVMPSKQEMIYNMSTQGYRNGMDGNFMARGRSGKSGKKHEAFRDDEYDDDNYIPARGRNMNINQLSDIKVLTSKPSNVRSLYDPSRRSKFVDPAYGEHVRSAIGHPQQITEPYWIPKSHGEAYANNPSFSNDYMDVDPRKMKMGNEFPDYRLKSQHFEGRIYQPEKRVKILPENIRGASSRNGGSNLYLSKGDRNIHLGEETPSDSSDQLEDDEDNIPLIMSKKAIRARSSISKSSFDEKKMKRTKKDVNESQLPHEGMATFGRYIHRPDFETYSSRSRQKDTSQNFITRVNEDSYYSGSGNPFIENDHRSTYIHGRNDQVFADLSLSLNNSSPMERRQKGNTGRDFVYKSKNKRDYNIEHEGVLFEGNSTGKSSRGDFDATLFTCTSSTKKKRKEFSSETNILDGSYYVPSHQLLSDTIPLKNWVKKRSEIDCRPPLVGTSETPIAEVRMPKPEPEPEPEPEVKPQKKILPPITPTIHTGFSFSIIHLLSAVRMALITPIPENSQNHGEKTENTGFEAKEQTSKNEPLNGSLDKTDVNNQSTEKSNFPSRTVQDIVNFVKSDPLDPCILETQEPLQDLVRGVLKIFSSKTAPLGAKGWKPLICYQKSSKCWCWCGPVPEKSTDLDPSEEKISPEAWKISRKMLVKLVDSYANWLKSGQETLQQIGSLPPPPMELMQQNFDEKERFKDLRAQKSLTTITRSSDEVRDYFRKEEQLRYSIPDRAFSYTAADGKKSIVAPLRRCGGKPTSKARDHFMLKRDRPPHVTILCLVRDAAARLPGNIGTRADVCTLIRDSQYVVEDVTDSQVNQVVSGALDRLHYERDPCVQFDGERKLWVYLHRDREEEDFEDDGTSSTKKWKRQKKDLSEQDDQVTVACHGGNIESNGFDLSSDLNVAPSCSNGEKISDLLCDDKRQKDEDNGKEGDLGSEADFSQILEKQLECQENSTNEEFDFET